MKARNIKVIFDTNVWISFLIGKRLQIISDYIVEGNIIVVTLDDLLAEIRDISKRDKFKKHFTEKKVKELIEFLEIIALKIDVHSKNTICRDPKDNFLLDLIEDSNAQVLVTGDKDLLELNPFKNAHILSPAQFD